MLGEYKYLKPQDESERQSATVEETFSPKDLARYTIICREEKGRDRPYYSSYMVFRDSGEMWKYCRRIPDDHRTFHEVIHGRRAQHIKFDIDAPVAAVDALSIKTFPALAEAKLGSDPRSPETRAAKMKKAMEVILDTILQELSNAYFCLETINPSLDDLIVASSTDPGRKFSYHVKVAPYAVASNEEAKAFTDQVVANLPPPLRAMVDQQVNSSTQNFRLTLSTKPGQKRWKRVTTEFGTAAAEPEDTLIVAPPGTRVLALAFTDGESLKRRWSAPDLNRADIEAVLALAAEATAGHELRCVRDGLLIFDRKTPTYCRICDRTHDRDNTLALAVRPAGPAPGDDDSAKMPMCEVVELCGRVPANAEKRSRLIGRLPLASAAPLTAAFRRAPGEPRGEAKSGQTLAAHVAEVAAGRVDPHEASAFERLPESRRREYAAPTMRPYELVPTLAVKAQMGLGKTRALRAHITKFFSAESLAPPVIRYISFRQTFSASLKDQFPDFHLYSDSQGALDHVSYPRLIVQVESLHRLMPIGNHEVDLLILDEVESIFAQFNSGLHKHFAIAFSVFSWLLRHSRHVICMDANLGDRTFAMLSKFRGDDKPPFFHWNRELRAKGDKYLFTGNYGAWLAQLVDEARQDRRLVIATNSLQEAKTLEELLAKEYPEKLIKCYTSETDINEKKEHFGNVAQYWAQFDILIYTPTVSAGVSFEVEHYDSLFGFFTDMSCDVETCRQMLARVRILRGRAFNICIRATPGRFPETIEDLGRAIRSRRQQLYIADSALGCRFTEPGEIEYFRSDYYDLFLENLRMQNLSINNFAKRFVNQVADTGASVGVLEVKEDAEARAGLLGLHDRMSKEIKLRRSEAIAEAPEITVEEAQAIRSDIQKQKAVTAEQVSALKRWTLCDAYAWHGRMVTTEFVRAYDNDHAKFVYQNLKIMADGPTVKEAVEKRLQAERMRYGATMGGRIEGSEYINEARDLQGEAWRYRALVNLEALWFLCALCGFACITDELEVPIEVLAARMRRNIRWAYAHAAVLKDWLEALKGSGAKSLPRPEALKKYAKSPRDPQTLVKGVLHFVNKILRILYGREIKKLPKARAEHPHYKIQLTPVGKLFRFAAESDGVRPNIPSRLRPVPPDVDGVLLDAVGLASYEAFYT